MMITDLLASITGEKPPAASSTPAKPVATSKRKAETQLTGAAAKTPRTTPPATSGTGRRDAPAGSSVSRIPDRSVGSASSNTRPPPLSRPGGDKTGSPAIAKPATNTVSNHGSTSSSTNGSRNRAAPAPAPARRLSPADAGPPKKRSFAEIMARAKAAQESKSATLGKITHKPLESSMAKREQHGKPGEVWNGSKTVKQDATRRHGGTGPARSASAGSGTLSRDTNGKSKKGAPVEEVKKVKKAALATTGYTGTARPRPGATPGKNGAASRVALGGPTPRERSRYRGPLAGPRRRRDEEDDEDLDDFIEYDDEEEEPGYGYGRGGGYDDMDDESDMEAGLTDVEEEERRAERAARLEDKKEAELEAKLKREKEERRRREMRMANR